MSTQKHQKLLRANHAPRIGQHDKALRAKREKHYKVTPLQLLLGALGCVASTLVASASIGYFALKEDFTTEVIADRKELVTGYQDHIDRLRAEIETLNGKQMVDQATVKIQVLDVLRSQQTLNLRHSMVADIVSQAESVGIYLSQNKPMPQSKPRIDQPVAELQEKRNTAAMGGESVLIDEPVKALGLRESVSTKVDPFAILQQGLPEKPINSVNVKKNSEKRSALEAIKTNIDEMNEQNFAAIDAISIATESQINEILQATRSLTPNLNSALRKQTAVGGPFLPIKSNNFMDHVDRAKASLRALKLVKRTANRLPIANPVPEASVSSSYGPRVDPFLGRLAFHSGIDFRAKRGTKVLATGPGTIVYARRKGGYGKMVEIRHANGFSTRYAHLSRISVKEGDHVIAGDIVGKVGSTGRSTGPHLHYEIRRSDKPEDPARFLSVGTKLKQVTN